MDDWTTWIKQIKEANDVVEVVGGYLALRHVGGTYKGLCPFHEDHRPSFDVDPRRQRYRCWSCGKNGDVINFVMEHDRVDFREALELLARRAGISLEKMGQSAHFGQRAVMLEIAKWAAEQFHRCLLDDPSAQAARHYLGERRFTGETVRRFQLGYAPPKSEWLVHQAIQGRLSLDTVEKVGLIARQTEGNGHYSRFRDRVMFPIRDRNGQVVGFGGRLLPSAPSGKAPKYYNSSDTLLFTKSEHLYGIDQARQAGLTAGYLAVVEGYTDVLMAHQLGIAHVVSTMGTAINARHVHQLVRWVPRVVLVFDADAGGNTGVDRALEIFVSQNVDLAVTALPEGLDPYDLLVQHGPETFRRVLDQAVDALEFKLNRVLAAEENRGIEGHRRALEDVLRVIAFTPKIPGVQEALQEDRIIGVKMELVVNRIAQRFAIKEETVWTRLRELRAARRPREDGSPENTAVPELHEGPAPARERQLLQVLLAEPSLVASAIKEITPEQLTHSGLQRLIVGLYALANDGISPDIDQLRARLDQPRLMAFALKAQEEGLAVPDRKAWLDQVVAAFRTLQVKSEQQRLQNQLQSASDHTEAVEILRQLQTSTVGSEPDSGL